MLRHILAAALLAQALGCDAESVLAPAPASGAPTVAWTDVRIGPTTVQFPCKAEQLAPGRTRCTLPDGADFSLVVAGVRRSELDELRQVKAYVQANPGAKLIQGDAFPVRWTENRWLHKEQHELHLAGGMECLLTVSYSTAEPPAAAGEFFSRARMR
jgi:hypothetical protein